MVWKTPKKRNPVAKALRVVRNKVHKVKKQKIIDKEHKRIMQEAKELDIIRGKV